MINGHQPDAQADLGFKVEVLGFSVWGLGFGVWGFGFVCVCMRGCRYAHASRELGSRAQGRI